MNIAEMTIKEIEKIFLQGEVTEAFLTECQNDRRKAAQQLVKRYPKALLERYKLKEEHLELSGEHLLEEIGKKRGHLRAGGIVDVERTAILVMDEFRSAKIGRLSLETPEELAIEKEKMENEGNNAETEG